MTTRDKILADVRRNQPPLVAAPDIAVWEAKAQAKGSLLETFATVAGNVGSRGSAGGFHCRFEIAFGYSSRLAGINHPARIAGYCQGCCLFANNAPHEMENVELAILQAEFGVAENSALWVTEKQMGTRVLPFICQHLALVVKSADIVPDMHAAYLRTQGSDHGFAAFIAGPSKTADIEQSLSTWCTWSEEFGDICFNAVKS
jgi:L-lactate dehydrogenase complex protein LldG